MGTDKLSYSEPLETSSNSFNKANDISVQKETEKQEKSKLLPKINDILDSFGIPEEEDKYRKILLNTPLDILKNTLSGTKIEIKQFLIQAQIDELEKKGLENLTEEEFNKYDKLSDNLIAVEKQETLTEKQETAENEELIATKDVVLKKEKQETLVEKQETEEATKTNMKLAQLRDVLLLNPKLEGNSYVDKIKEKFLEIKKLKIGNDAVKNIDIEKEKGKIADEIKAILHTPGILKSISDDLGGADVDNVEYRKFKESAIGVDESLRPYFEDLEKIEVGGAFGMDDLVGASVVEGSEKNEFGTMVDIDLMGDGDVLMRHRVGGGEYGFEVKIEQSELDEIMKENAVQVEYLKSGVKNINSFGVGFEELKFELGKNWNSPDFISEIPYMLQKFPTDIFDELKKTYSDLKLDSSSLITKSDIDSLLDVDNREELGPKIIAINEKMKNTQEALQNKETEVVSEYTEGFRALAQEKMKNKEQEADTLKFLHSIGFDMFANSDVDGIIRQINISKGRFGLSEDIDLAKGNLGTVYGGENNVERKNFARIVNILFSGKSSS